MANYSVDIAVAVKNTQAITQLSNSVKETRTKVNRLNEILEKFGDNIGGTVVNSVKNFSNATKEAAVNLNETALGSRKATRAAKEFVRAVDLENAALREQAALLAQVRNQGKSGMLRGGTQFSSPIGPGPASSTALSSPLPARSTRTTQYLDAIGPISPQERTGRAEQIAREAALRSAANQKDFEARRTFQTKLFNIEKQFKNSLEQQRRETDSDEFDRLLKRLNAEKNKLKEIGDLRAKINQKEIEDFDKRFKQARDLRGQTSPIGGAVDIPGSPAAKAAKEGGGKGLSNLALGVGFPLLFGGGAGSIAGGALGSVGGMGGQVLGSAVGGIVDTFAASVGKLGQALDPLTADIDALVEASGLAGTETGKLISSLKEFVGIEKSLEIATQQLAAVVGEEGVQALKSYGKANSELSAELGLAFSSLAAAAAPLLEGIAKATTNKFEEMRLYSRGVGEFKDDPIIKQAREDRRFSIDQSGFEKTVLERARELENIEKRKAEAELQSVAGGKERLKVLNQESIILENRGDLLKESVQNSKLELINIEEKLETEKLNNRAKETGMTLAQKTLEQDILAIKFGNQKLTLENQITDAQSRQFKNQDRRAKAAVRSANAYAKRVQRELEARAKGIDSAKIGRDQSSLSLAKTDLERTFLLDGELAGLEQKLKVIELEKRTKEQVLDTQYKQGQLAAKSVEEQNLLFEEYLNQDRIITLTAQTQKQQTEELIKQIGLVEQVSALSAAAGFDVLGLANNTDPFQSTGMYGADTGPVSFEAGMELAPLIAYQVELDKVLAKYPMIGEAATAAADLVTFGVQEMINGTKSAEQVFADFLKSVADMLMKTAAQMIAQYIAIGIAKLFAGGNPSSFSSFSESMSGGNPFSPGTTFNVPSPAFDTFADGGSPPVGKPSIVGERGPELFVPKSSGTIIPNHELGGGTNVVVNVDASGSKAEGDDAKSKELGKALGMAIQSELIKQKRPGGILA